jgi:NAD(P)-dependent dehydrogenase (short-subunit alcohol dehydrogenase family)
MDRVTDHSRVSRAQAPWAEHNVPDLAGRTAIVTGANSGIGYETTRVLSNAGAHVVMACRDLSRAADAERRIIGERPSGSVEVMALDLADLDSVAAGSAAFVAKHARLDILVNNAGVMCTPQGVTAQGFETQFGVNHLGHLRLTSRLLLALLAAPGSRVVIVSSLSHRSAIDFDDLPGTRRYSPLGAYCQSAAANLLFSFELQARLRATALDRQRIAPATSGRFEHQLGTPIPAARLHGGVPASPVRRRLHPERRHAADAAPLPDPTWSAASLYGPDGFLEIYGYPVLRTARSKPRDQALTRLWDVSVAETGSPLPAHE